MLGDELYPLFDEYGDKIALSVGYTRKKGGKTVSYFDAYTAGCHIKWSNGQGSGWAVVEDEENALGKIPAVYMYRPTPIWKDTGRIVSEIEWAFTITDEKDTIANLTTANGGKPLVSHRESIETYGHSSDVDKTMQEIAEDGMADSFNLTA